MPKKPTKPTSPKRPAPSKPAAHARKAAKPAKSARPILKKETPTRHAPAPTRAAKPAPAPKAAAKPATKPAPAKAAPPPAKAAVPPPKPAPAPAKAAPAKAAPDKRAEPAPTPRLKIDAKLAKSSADKPAKRVRPAAPIAFSLEEALEVAKANAKRSEDGLAASNHGPSTKVNALAAAPVPQEQRVLASASLADILGYNPEAGLRDAEEKRVPEKFSRYYKLLVDLRDHVTEGLSRHAEDTLMKSAKEDSGDLSGYSQHMADAGTDTFDRDFALSLVANEQEALFEIEEAIKRIHAGTYGTCELTGKPIARERLLAVPFARFSVEAQADMERTRRMRNLRGGLLAEGEEEDGAGGGEEDADT